MRLFKDSTEIDTMRRAAQISARAHARAMQRVPAACAMVRTCASTTWRPSCCTNFAWVARKPTPLSWRQVPNACVLHLPGRQRRRAGGRVLIDAGLASWTATPATSRTFQPTGALAQSSDALYDIVLAAQEAVVAATRPGARFTDPHDAAVRQIAQGLLDVGLLDANKVAA